MHQLCHNPQNHRKSHINLTCDGNISEAACVNTHWNGRLDTPVNENHAVFMNLHLSTTIDKLKTDANHAHGQLYKKNASHLI